MSRNKRQLSNVLGMEKKGGTDGQFSFVLENAPLRQASCPRSNTLSRQVHRRTLEHLLKPEKIEAVQHGHYYYCTEQHCEVVYFSVEFDSAFTVDDLAVKVFAKDQSDDVPVCYCFGWTRERIKKQMVETGKSTALAEISREVKAGTCACDVKNPKGDCCLGDVNSCIASLTRENQSTVATRKLFLVK